MCNYTEKMYIYIYIHNKIITSIDNSLEKEINKWHIDTNGTQGDPPTKQQGRTSIAKTPNPNNTDFGIARHDPTFELQMRNRGLHGNPLERTSRAKSSPTRTNLSDLRFCEFFWGLQQSGSKVKSWITPKCSESASAPAVQKHLSSQLTNLD